MLLWATIAILTLAASLAVLLPLTRRGDAGAATTAEHDLEVYRDQLGEVERDHERGVIGAVEAEQAKAEIGRRILKVAAASTASTSVGTPRWAIAAAVLSVPLVSWGLYAELGAPDVPAQPLSARLERDPAQSSIEELVARAEGHLRANPSDGRGWDVLAPIYLRMGRPGDAVTAYRNAIRLLGATAPRESGLGEAIAAASGGLVTAEAAEAFRRALAIEPTEPRARYYLASGLAQERRFDEALAIWRDMKTTLPAGSPWAPAVERAITQATAEAAQLASAPQAGPSAADVAAADQMSAEDRTAMIEGMVAQLDQRLRENPQDEEGWKRLVRSYTVLQQPDVAADALARGVAALGAETDAGKALIAFAAELGVKGGASQ